MTYSIVARDAATGELGVAVQSHYFACGSAVAWARAGVGAVATQAIPLIGYGPDGLDAMASGATAREALGRLLHRDPMPSVRQVAMVDAAGRVGVHTGAGCIGAAGHRVGGGVSVQANMVAGPDVWKSMLDAYVSSAGSADLAGRLLAGLEAAEAAGGDARGAQAAALVVVDGHGGDAPWEGRLVDIRVDDHPDPLTELARLLDVQRACAQMHGALGDALLNGSADPETTNGALRALTGAQAALGENREPSFWAAVIAARGDDFDAARGHLAQATGHRPAWAKFVGRVADAGLLTPEQRRELDG